jgi:hypothetical protein
MQVNTKGNAIETLNKARKTQHVIQVGGLDGWCQAVEVQRPVTNESTGFGVQSFGGGGAWSVRQRWTAGAHSQPPTLGAATGPLIPPLHHVPVAPSLVIRHPSPVLAGQALRLWRSQLRSVMLMDIVY